jgi:hypothetical protein
VKIGTVKLIDNGDGQTLTNYVAAFPAIFHTVLASVRDTVGIDVPKILQGQPSEGAKPATKVEGTKEVKK